MPYSTQLDFEMISLRKSGKHWDVFSVGVVLLEVLLDPEVVRNLKRVSPVTCLLNSLHSVFDTEYYYLLKHIIVYGMLEIYVGNIKEKV
jgi:hypothetical protein